MNNLFTIGHSTHEFERFLSLLKLHRIEVLADVRTSPVSRFEWFCGESLKKQLKANGINYVFLGKELGARREERCCYIGTRADYDLIAKTPAFRDGLKRLKEGVAKFRVALMCAEREPLDCHRTVLVCRHAKTFVDISHIHADGHLEPHATAESRMMARYTPSEDDFFLSRVELLNDAYRRRGLEINYIEKLQHTAETADGPSSNEF